MHLSASFHNFAEMTWHMNKYLYQILYLKKTAWKCYVVATYEYFLYDYLLVSSREHILNTLDLVYNNYILYWYISHPIADRKGQVQKTSLCLHILKWLI